MNESVSMVFKTLCSIERLSPGAAIGAFLAMPSMVHSFEPNIAAIVKEAARNGVHTISMFRTVQAAPRQHTGQPGYPDPENLFGQDVIDTFLQVRNLGSQPLRQPRGDLSQEDPRLGTRIEESHSWIGP